jgi:hypothetical protein
MNEFERRDPMNHRRTMGHVLAVTTLLAAPLAAADTVLTKDSPLITGTQSHVYSLLAPSAGTVTVKLTELNFPDRLENLSFALTTASGVLTTLDGAGDLQFDLTGAGTYYAILNATGAGRFSLGQASLSVMFAPLAAPVPLPGAFVLLLSGLAGIGSLKLRRGRKTAPTE